MNLTVIKKHAYAHWMHAAVCVLVAAGLTACVTINIYFPAAAAEKAADKVIDEIWQAPAGQEPSSDQHSAPAATPVMPSATQVVPSVKQEPAP